jgi:streptogramin lyase
MLKKTFMAVTIATAAITLFFAASGLIRADGSRGIALTGKVSSEKEGPMEGVLISAKKDGATITITVVSDEKGRYSFPTSKLAPGNYSFKIRAIGYDLDGPKAVDVAPDKATTADIKLRKTKNLSAQLTNAEWIASIPGTDDQKKFLLSCNSCHSLQPIVKSTHDADEFMQVFQRMSGYYPGSTPLRPQRLVGDARREGMLRGANVKASAEWLAGVNLSSSQTWEYPLKTLSRPKGKATRVIITEYDLPRETIEPHDVIVDSNGMVWYSDFGDQFLGNMDPKTGKVTEYPIPELKAGFPRGTLDLETDKEGNLWVALMYQGGIAKFDKKSQTFQTWAIPKEWQTDATQQAFLSPISSHVDGKVWVKNSDKALIYRLDLATGKFENFGSFKDPVTNQTIGSYGIPADSKNNLYLLDFSAGNIGRLDAKTGKLTVYRTPTPNSRPRRGIVDSQDRLWFAEYAGNAIGMFDPKTERIQEWALPTPWSAPYDVVPDKNGEVWTGSMWTDLITRLDPKSGQFTEYLLPKSTNIRRVFVDSSTTPVTFWVGSNHGASIIKLEPLD